MIRGEGTAIAHGVTPQEVFDFVLDPAQYTKADTKMVWVTKLGDTADGMIAREDGRFLGRFPGSVITRYRWHAPHRIDVTLEHGVPQHLHAWLEIDEVEGGTRIHHVEEMDLGRGPRSCSRRGSAVRAWPPTTTGTRVSRGNRGHGRPAPDASRPARRARGWPCCPACTGTSSRARPTRNKAPLSRDRVGPASRYCRSASALRTRPRVARSVARARPGAAPSRPNPPMRGTVIVRYPGTRRVSARTIAFATDSAGMP